MLREMANGLRASCSGKALQIGIEEWTCVSGGGVVRRLLSSSACTSNSSGPDSWWCVNAVSTKGAQRPAAGWRNWHPQRGWIWPSDPGGAASDTALTVFQDARTIASSAVARVEAHAGRSYGVIKRFYKKVDVTYDAEQAGWVIWLDHRRLKTPARKQLSFRSKSLALAIAAEWEYQDMKGIRPITMPLMTCASMAVDQPKKPSVVVPELAKYLATDVVTCRVNGGKLGELQAQTCDPIIDWARSELGLDLHATDSIFGADPPPDTLQRLDQILYGLDANELTAVELLTGALKSIVLALALTRGRITIAEGIVAARMEEDFQIEEWGLVEGGHDLDISDLKVRVAGPVLFLRMMQNPDL